MCDKTLFNIRLLVIWCLAYGLACGGHVIRRRRDSMLSCMAESHTLFYDCAAALNEHFDDISNTSVVPVLSEERLDDLCVTYTQSDLCIQEYFSRCSVQYAYFFDVPDYQGFNDSYHFLCNEAREEYLATKWCYDDPGLIEEDKECNQTFQHDLEALEVDSYYSRNEFCGLINEYLDCLEGVATRICDEQSGRWYRVMVTKNLEPYYRQPYFGCEIDKSGYLHFIDSTTANPGSGGGSTTPTTTTVKFSVEGDNAGANTSYEHPGPLSMPVLIACIVACSLLIVSMMILILIRCKHIHSRRNHMRQQQQQNPHVFYGNQTPVIFHSGVAQRPAMRGAAAAAAAAAGATAEVTYGNEKQQHLSPHPAPVYGYINPALPAYVDARNGLFTPPPPYNTGYIHSPPGAPPLNPLNVPPPTQNGYSNSTYSGPETGNIANVD